MKKYIKIDFRKQETGNWCWAACIQMVLANKERQMKTQCGVATDCATIMHPNLLEINCCNNSVMKLECNIRLPEISKGFNESGEFNEAMEKSIDENIKIIKLLLIKYGIINSISIAKKDYLEVKNALEDKKIAIALVKKDTYAHVIIINGYEVIQNQAGEKILVWNIKDPAENDVDIKINLRSSGRFQEGEAYSILRYLIVGD